MRRMFTSLDPEREEELIEKISRFVVENKVEAPVIFILESIKPLSIMGSQLARFYLAPYLPFIGEIGEEAIALFQSRESLERLLQRIEELSEKETEQAAQGKQRI